MARRLFFLLFALGTAGGTLAAMGVDLEVELGHGRICLFDRPLPC